MMSSCKITIFKRLLRKLLRLRKNIGERVAEKGPPQNQCRLFAYGDNCEIYQSGCLPDIGICRRSSERTASAICPAVLSFHMVRLPFFRSLCLCFQHSSSHGIDLHSTKSCILSHSVVLRPRGDTPGSQ